MARYQDEPRLSSILDRVLSPDLVAIDGGARNGIYDLPRLAKYINVHGFEPNPAEYDRLLKIEKKRPGAYHSTRYTPYALLERRGSATLYINKRTGATSTIRPNDEFLRHFTADNWSQIRQVVGEEQVEGVTLGDYLGEQKISHIDWLKLDTQGNELPILQGAGAMIGHISVIKVEVEMVPLYENQPLFGDVFNFLIANGFQFVDLQTSRPCRRYHTGPNFDLSSYRLIWGDAIFVHDPFRFDAPRKLQQGIILAELGYVDLGVYIIRNVPSLSSENKEALVDEYTRPRSPASNTAFKRWLKRLLPQGSVEAVRAFGEARQTNEVPLVP